MRVTLDLAPSGTARPAGTLRYPGLVEPIAFDGWLDLMRLLESLTAAANSPASPSLTTASAGGDATDLPVD